MKLARTLLASAAVALLAACSSDLVGPSDAAREPLKPRHLLTADSTTLSPIGDGSGGYDSNQDVVPCVDAVVQYNGITTTVRTCDGRGPQLGTGS